MTERYVLTERVDGEIPSNDDGNAQAFKRTSGVFDLRDVYNARVIVATSRNLESIRKMQAKLNSKQLGSI